MKGVSVRNRDILLGLGLALLSSLALAQGTPRWPAPGAEQSAGDRVPSEFVDERTGVRLVIDGACRENFDYPVAAKRAKASGDTRVQVQVDKRGHITDVRLLQSSGPTREHRELDRAATEAFATCRVVLPSASNWQAQPSEIVAVYPWRLHD